MGLSHGAAGIYRARMPLFGAPGERVGYEFYRHPDGAPPLVLIHGFTASRASFEVNLAGLREHFSVITVELLGHGESEAPEDAAPYQPARAVRRVLQLVEHLGYQRALICGHSLGGALALRIALDAPEWVAGLVVINSSSAAGSPEWREQARPSMAEMAARVRADGTAFMKQTRLYPAHSKRLDATSRGLLTRDFDRLQPSGVAGTAQSLVVDVNAWERHPELSVPMLLVVGDRDSDFAPNAAPFLARFPQHLVRQKHLPEAGHAANIEQPREFEAAVTEFAREIAYLRRPAPPLGSNRMLTALGGALVVTGLGLLGAAVLFNGGANEDPTLLAAAPEVTRPAVTQTPLAGVAGTRVPGAVAVNTPAPASQSPAATTAPATQPAVASATATAVSATATLRPPTATPVPDDTPLPTATAIATALPTSTAVATSIPGVPFSSISGPSSGAVGEPLTLYVIAGPADKVLRTDLTMPSGQVLTHQSGGTFTATAPGCYVATARTTFRDGQVLVSSQAVSVGGGSC